jgi:hypothetical protein
LIPVTIATSIRQQQTALARLPVMQITESKNSDTATS